MFEQATPSAKMAGEDFVRHDFQALLKLDPQLRQVHRLTGKFSPRLAQMGSFCSHGTI